ncbi:6523_t:CDS:1, partial [Racocetra fulgida]
LIKDTTNNLPIQHEEQNLSKEKAENKKVQVSENFKLLLSRFVDNDHLSEYKEKSNACVWR